MAEHRQRSIKGAAAGLLVAVLVVLVPVVASSVPGEPVPSFAGSGALALDRGDRAFSVDASGRIVVATAASGSGVTSLKVRRYTPAGAADTTFSGDGATDLTFSGARLGPPQIWHRAGGTQVALWARGGLHVWQLDGSGAPEASFGADGLAIVPVGSPSGFQRVEVLAVGDDLVSLQNEGAVGRIDRLDADGQPVASFGGDGSIETPKLFRVAARPGGGLVAVTSLGLQAVAADGTVGDPVWNGDDGYLLDLAVDAQDRVLVTRQPPGYTVTSTTLQRLTSDLAVDPAYGDGGSISLVGVAGGFQEVEGRRYVVTVATASPGPGYTGLVRISALTADGALDPSFGTGGTALVVQRFSEGTFVDGPSAPSAILAPGPAGGLAVGAEYRWREASILINRTEHGLHQLSATGEVLASYPLYASEVTGLSVTDGGDHGATVLAIAGREQARMVRMELQQPNPPGAPGPPVVTAVDGASVTLTWTPAAGTPDRYVVSVFRQQVPTPPVVAEVPASQRSATVTVPRTGAPYRFDVYAASGAAVGPRSVASGFVLPPFATMAEFVDLLGADVPSWYPTTEDRASVAAFLEKYGDVEESVGKAVGDRTFRSEVEPVVRLYTAYFGRVPDRSGLRYWLGKRRAGVTVARISAQFAGSSEFQRTYGRLSDRAFLDLVYRNVLGRAPDPSGLDYWTGRLSSRRTSRGHLMASFSESDEHVRKQAWPVEAVRSYFVILGRAPSAAEVAAWTTDGPSAVEKRAALMQSEEYAARVG